MRSDILTYLKANSVSGFSVSEELPWEASGQPLYLKNMKKIYVDRPQTVQEPLIETFDNRGVVDETTTVVVYVSTDAKNLPTNYDTMVNTVRLARLENLTEGWRQRLTEVETSFESDNLVTQFTFSFTKLIIN